jgi:hypothetical protein
VKSWLRWRSCYCQDLTSSSNKQTSWDWLTRDMSVRVVVCLLFASVGAPCYNDQNMLHSFCVSKFLQNYPSWHVTIEWWCCKAKQYIFSNKPLDVSEHLKVIVHFVTEQCLLRRILAMLENWLLRLKTQALDVPLSYAGDLEDISSFFSSDWRHSFIWCCVLLLLCQTSTIREMFTLQKL